MIWYEVKIENWDGVKSIKTLISQKSLIILRNNYSKIAEALIGNIDEIYVEIKISKHSGIPGEKN